MLNQLLSLLEEERAWSLEDLAGALNTDVSSVKAKLEYLERIGLLKQVHLYGGCDKNCSGCSGCGEQNRNMPVIWERGK